jgi:hypothetical protein
VNRTVRSAGARALRRMVLPLASYYGIALAVPIANGAAERGAPFWNHALVVLIVPLMLIVFVSLVCEIVRAFASARVTGRTSPSPS